MRVLYVDHNDSKLESLEYMYYTNHTIPKDEALF